MSLHSIAILSPGDMGSGIGRDLTARGFDVVTCLAGRGEGSRTRAQAAGIRDLPDLDTLVAEADLVLSILPPESAPALAREVAAAIGGFNGLAVFDRDIAAERVVHYGLLFDTSAADQVKPIIAQYLIIKSFIGV